MAESRDRIVSAAGGRLDRISRCLDRSGVSIQLTRREADLLDYLASRPGQVVSRDTLHLDVWEFSPSVVTRAADFTIRRLRQKIEPDPANPTWIHTEPGEGYRYVESRAEPTRVASTLPQPHNSLVGRSAVAAAVLAAFGEGKNLVTLAGPGGVGKSRLAIELAHASVHAVWVPLAESRTAEDLVAAFALALRLPTASPEKVGLALAGRPDVLVVLDSVEPVREACRSVLVQWSEAAPGVRFLLTSRQPLAVAGERVITLEPLPVDEAVGLFVERAEAVRPGVGFDTAALDAVRAVCATVDNLPLAIELAAARVAVMSPETLLSRVRAHLSVLDARTGKGPARHATLSATVDWSWSLLPDDARVALAQLALFEGGFDLDAAEAVVSVPGGRSVWKLLEDLGERSLVSTSWLASGVVRFSLLSVVRRFALDQLTADAEAEQAARRRHAAFFGGLTASGASLAEAGTARARLSTELPNLLVAARACPEEDLRARALVAALPALEGTRSPAFVRDLAGPLTRLDEAELALPITAAHGRARRRLGEAAAVRLEEAERQWPSLSSTLAVDWALVRSATVRACGDLSEARAHAERAIDLAGADPHEAGRAFTALGACFQDEHRRAEAEAAYREGAMQARRGGAFDTLGSALGNLGILLADRELLGEARLCYEEALEIHRALDNRLSETIALQNLGNLAADERSWQDAERRLAESLSVARSLGYPLAIASSRMNLAAMHQASGDLSRALDEVERARDPLLDAGGTGWVPYLDALDASIRADLGQVAASRSLLERHASPTGPAETVLSLGWVHLLAAEAVLGGGFTPTALADCQQRLADAEAPATSSRTLRSSRNRARTALAHAIEAL